MVKLVLILLGILFLPRPIFAQASTCPQLNQSISEFIDQGAAGFLVWQYSGDRLSPLENDPYSFFKGSPVCQTLTELKDQYPGKFFGVNIHSLAKYDENTIRDHLQYLSSECGTSVIRIWGSSDRASPQKLRSLLDIASQFGIRVIIALADYSNGSGQILPSSIRSNPTSWYQSGYQTFYLPHVSSVVSTIGQHPSLLAYELANEPHCGGQASCPAVYNQWVDHVSSVIRSLNSSVQISIGQMASQNTTFGDSPGHGSPSDYTQSNSQPNITYSSAHYYNNSERNNALQALNQAKSLGKTFYLGEAPSLCLEHELEDCNFENMSFPPININSAQNSPPRSGVVNVNNKHPDNYVIRPGQRYICTTKVQLSETFQPKSVATGQTTPDGNQVTTYQEYSPDELKKEIEKRQVSNEAGRTSQNQFSTPLNNFTAPQERINTAFKNYSSWNASVRMTPEKDQQKLKANILSTVPNTLRPNPDGTAQSEGIDEQIAWGCNSGCFHLGCGQPDPNCRPVYLSELSWVLGFGDSSILSPYYDGCSSGSCGYLIDNPGVGFQRLSDSCYDRLFQYLNLISNGSVESQVTIHNINEDGSSSPYQVTRLLPASNQYASQNYSNIIGLIMPQNQQDDVPIPDNCQPIPNAPSQDTSNPISTNIFYKFAQWLKNIFIRDQAVHVEQELLVQTSYEETHIQNIAKDEAAVSGLLPEKVNQALSSVSKSSTTDNEPINIPEPGNSLEKKREQLGQWLLPDKWAADLGTPQSYQRPVYPPTELPHQPGNVDQWCQYINQYAQENDLEPSLIYGIITIESGGSPTAISSQGAVGLMQVMPSDGLGATFMCRNGPCFADRPTTQELLNPEFNVQYATRLLAGLIDYWGSVTAGVSHYGPMDHPTYASLVLAVQQRNPDACQTP